MYIVMSYAVYLAVSLTLTVWVARTLEQSGRVFLEDAFQGDSELRDSLKRLLRVGFYLINIGFVTMVLSTSRPLMDVRAALELALDKIGWVLLVLGIVHFFTVLASRRLLTKARERYEHARPAQGGGGWSPESAALGKVLE